MRDFHLRFFKEQRWQDGAMDLIKEELTGIPSKAGAYILGSSDGTMFIYPWGRSPIFYIGQSSNLLKRLKQHKKYISQAIDDHTDKYWWPRYQFGASFGASIAWYTARGSQNPNVLEADLITSFYDSFGSIPVSNGTWPSGLRPKHGSRDDK